MKAHHGALFGAVITLGILAILGRWGGPVSAPARAIVGA